MELLREGAKELGLVLSLEHLAAFEQYYQELASWNQRFNLTAVTAYQEVQIRHFLDSLSCLLALSPGGNRQPVPDTVPLQLTGETLWCADVGTGAGFPGIPIKILLPDLRLTLIEATRKKTEFLRHIVATLGLKHVTILNARSEEVGHLAEHRERYDLVLARAVAHLSVLVEYCLPLCRPGGRMVAQKGEDAALEASEAQAAIELLGGKGVQIKAVELSGMYSERYLVIVDKGGHTPDAYPRRPGMPSKRPLS